MLKAGRLYRQGTRNQVAEAILNSNASRMTRMPRKIGRLSAVLCAGVSIVVLSSLPISADTAQQQLIQTNTNRPGLDYTNFDVPQPLPGSIISAVGNCQAACQRDSNCLAWTFVNAGVQGANARCWLKNGIPAVQGDGCCTSGVAMQPLEPHTDRPGNDYKNFDLPTPDSGQCRAACGNDKQCQAWTYVNPGVQGPNARCWLKNAVPGAHASQCCTTGVINRPPVIH